MKAIEYAASRKRLSIRITVHIEIMINALPPSAGPFRLWS